MSGWPAKGPAGASPPEGGRGATLVSANQQPGAQMGTRQPSWRGPAGGLCCSAETSAEARPSSLRNGDVHAATLLRAHSKGWEAPLVVSANKPKVLGSHDKAQGPVVQGLPQLSAVHLHRLPHQLQEAPLLVGLVGLGPLRGGSRGAGEASAPPAPLKNRDTNEPACSFQTPPAHPPHLKNSDVIPAGHGIPFQVDKVMGRMVAIAPLNAIYRVKTFIHLQMQTKQVQMSWRAQGRGAGSAHHVGASAVCPAPERAVWAWVANGPACTHRLLTGPGCHPCPLKKVVHCATDPRVVIEALPWLLQAE